MNMEALPYNKSILPAIMKQDPSPKWQQVVLLLITSAAVMLTPMVPLVLTHSPFGLSDAFDRQHGLETYGLWDLIIVIEMTLGLSRHIVGIVFTVSASAFLVLLVCDAMGVQWDHILSAGLHRKVFHEMGSSECYDQMFCEPARPRKLVARPGNTYSNFFYLFGGSLLITAIVPGFNLTKFWASDLLFGVMLVTLSICSVLWHATNMPVTHYADLWAMDSCIAYLIVRVLCLGPHMCLVASSSSAIHIAQSVMQNLMPSCCFIAFAFCIILLGQAKFEMYDKRLLHYSCPFSGRSRLYKEGKVGNKDMTVASLCLFGGMSVLYTLPLVLSQLTLLKTVGSILAYRLTLTMLVTGWSYRMLERFCADGCFLMNWVLKIPDGLSTLRVFLSAAVSPTAILHWTTGITLIAGYCSIKSMELSIS